MKIRTDFVTNSSSSSFIFGEPGKNDTKVSDVLKLIRGRFKVLVETIDLAYEKFLNTSGKQFKPILPDNIRGFCTDWGCMPVSKTWYDIGKRFTEVFNSICQENYPDIPYKDDYDSKWFAMSIVASFELKAIGIGTILWWAELTDEEIDDISNRVDSMEYLTLPYMLEVYNLQSIEDRIVSGGMIYSYEFDEGCSIMEKHWKMIEAIKNKKCVPELVEECMDWGYRDDIDDEGDDYSIGPFEPSGEIVKVLDGSKRLYDRSQLPNKHLGQVLIGRRGSECGYVIYKMIESISRLSCPHMG